MSTDAAGQLVWVHTDWKQIRASAAEGSTVVYVHGNRVEPGEATYRGLRVYQSMKSSLRRPPQRFIIWSWPSSTIAGPVKDVHIKAARTPAVGWQLAWFLDQLPAEANVSLVGYSFGARVISGALHVLGRGSLGSLRLNSRQHPDLPPLRVGMIAAAYDADWLQPGHFHQRAMSQVERLILVTNHRDPAMRLYHFSVERGRVHALGKTGPTNPGSLKSANRRIKKIDVSHSVGRSHALVDYLAASSQLRTMWRQVCPQQQPTVQSDQLAGLAASQ